MPLAFNQVSVDDMIRKRLRERGRAQALPPVGLEEEEEPEDLENSVDDMIRRRLRERDILEEGFPTQVARTLASGVVDVPLSIAGSMQARAIQTETEQKAFEEADLSKEFAIRPALLPSLTSGVMKDLSKRASDFLQEVQDWVEGGEENIPEELKASVETHPASETYLNPKWWVLNAAKIAPTAAAMILLTRGAASTSLSVTGSPAAAILGGGAAASHASGVLEGGLHFFQALEEGKSEEQAADEAGKVGAASAGITALAAGTQIGLAAKGGLLSKVVSAFLEPVEESTQQISANIITDRDPFEGVADAALLSLPFGAAQSQALRTRMRSGLETIERTTRATREKLTGVVSKIKDQREQLGRPRLIGHPPPVLGVDFVAGPTGVVGTPEELQGRTPEEATEQGTVATPEQLSTEREPVFHTLVDVIEDWREQQTETVKSAVDVVVEARRLAYEDLFSLEPDSEYHNMLKREAKKQGISDRVIEETTPLRLEDILSRKFLPEPSQFEVTPEGVTKKVRSTGELMPVREADLRIGSRFRTGKKGILQYEVNEITNDGGVRAFRVDDPQAKRRFKPDAQVRPMRKSGVPQPKKAGDRSPEALGIVLPFFSTKAKKPTRTFSDPEVEKAHQDFHGVKNRPLRDKISDLFSKYRSETGDFGQLPHTGEFASLRFTLHILRKQKAVASTVALENLDIITESLRDNPDAADLFERKVLLDDLEYESSQGRPLPNLWTADLVATDKASIDAEVETNARVQEALRWRDQVWSELRNDYTAWMKEIGVSVSEKFQNPHYFRHQVVDYARGKAIWGVGERLKSPTQASFLRERKGGGGINTNYIEAEHEVMSQMLYDIQVAKTLKMVDDKMNIVDSVKAKAKQAGDAKNWRNAKYRPEGYVLWQPQQGNMFFMVDTIPAKIAEQVRNGLYEDIMTPEQIKQVFAIGSPKKEFVVRKEVADTLNRVNKITERQMLNRVGAGITRGLKTVWVHGPRRFLKFTLRNLTGDADALFVGNPAAFLKVPRAIRDLYQANKADGQMSSELREWFYRTGHGTTFQAQELGDLNKLEPVVRRFGEQKLTDVPMDFFKGYWKATRMASDVRESVMRYAAYLDYLEQMQKNPQGRPKNFGASIREEVMGLDDIRDRAHVLSNQLLGAYDEVSQFGTQMREMWVPFWSFQETNMRRYKRMAQNAWKDGKLAEQVGRKVVTTGLMIPVKVGRFLIAAAAMKSMLIAWNHFLFGEEEDDLSDFATERAHAILPNLEVLLKEGRLTGRDQDGKVLYFSRMGALDDFLEWFGMPEVHLHLRDYLNGTRTPAEIAKDMGENIPRKIAGSIGPLKLAGALVWRAQLFPDPLEPRHIRDRGLFLARSLGLAPEYKWAFGLPARPYGEGTPDALLYRADPGQAAYSDFYAVRKKFMKKIGESGTGFWESPRGNALYNFRQALRYEDKEAQVKYFKDYIALGGTPKGVMRSIKNLNPLGGMSKIDRIALVSSLNKTEMKLLMKSLRYYSEILLGGSTPQK